MLPGAVRQRARAGAPARSSFRGCRATVPPRGPRVSTAGAPGGALQRGAGLPVGVVPAAARADPVVTAARGRQEPAALQTVFRICPGRRVYQHDRARLFTHERQPYTWLDE